MRRATLVLAATLALTAGACGDERLVSLRLPGDVGAPPPADAGTEVAAPGACPDQLVGYGVGTVGGQGGTRVTVTNVAALETAANLDGPVIIQIDRMIAVTMTTQVRVKSKKTIIGVGVGTDSGLEGGGLNLAGYSDIIIRNLKISKAVGTDAVSLNKTTHVWIDHCDLSSAIDDGQTYDGLVDITHASDQVTVSWTKFHDHLHPSIIGHSDDNGAQDTGHLNVTFHHNLVMNTDSGSPSVRFGTLHAFDNHYVVASLNAIVSRMGAHVLAEDNVFDTVLTPLTTHSDSAVEGFLNQRGNVFTNSGPNDIDVAQVDTWAPPYAYVADPATAVPDLVSGCAGLGRVPPDPAP